jgi:hypothetical protein
MQTIVFTICSINYLAQAKVLGASLLQHNPNFKFHIGLVDIIEKSGIDSSRLPNYPIVEVSDLQIDGFEQMYEQYNITELNTAVKPFYFQYFYSKYPDTANVIYLDPDIEVFQPFTNLLAQLQSHSIILTPHVLEPYTDMLQPRERDLLNTGIFNLGFLATSNNQQSHQFLEWWAHKLRHQCYINLAEGMFVDQLWVNFAPVYWSNVLIFRDKAYNMAYWNLHERNLGQQNNSYIVNNSEPLVFFHFSGYNPFVKTQISKYQTRYNFEQRPDLKQIFDNYAQKILENDHDFFRQYRCQYLKPEPQWQPPKRGQRPRKFIIKILEKIIDYVK